MNLLLSLSRGEALGSGIRTPATGVDRECCRGRVVGEVKEERGASHMQLKARGWKDRAAFDENGKVGIWR